MAKHLYIHIPFCNSICAYCDFVRFVCNNTIKHEYINKIVKQISSIKNKMDSIYIGGGTPNSLNNVDLFNLLNTCKKLCSTKTEFTIECNPEFINQEQIDIFKKNKINRISLGVQFANDKLLKQFGRKHDVQKCVDAIKLLQSNKINNISCDFIYGINELTNVIIKKDLEFIYKNKIPHCSFYSLELKHNSKLTKDGYKINEEFQEQQLQYIEKNIKYKRYEVSNWVINKKYESVHNKAYWLSKDWIGIGLGAHGFEDKKIYENVGTVKKWNKKITKLSNKDYYFQIIMMGLRLKEGLDLNNKTYKSAYDFFGDKIKKYTMIKNNHLSAKNINLIDNILLEII